MIAPSPRRWRHGGIEPPQCDRWVSEFRGYKTAESGGQSGGSAQNRYRVMLALALAALAKRRVARRLHRTIPPIPAAIRISAAASGSRSIGDHGNRPTYLLFRVSSEPANSVPFSPWRTLIEQTRLIHRLRPRNSWTSSGLLHRQPSHQNKQCHCGHDTNNSSYEPWSPECAAALLTAQLTRTEYKWGGRTWPIPEID
jgi:hypothetical protein